MSAFIIFGILIGFIFLGVPVCFSIAYSGIGYILSSQAQPLILIAQRSLNGMDNYTLLAIPLFTLAGFIMDKGGLSKRLVAFLERAFFWIPGGIGTITVLCCAVFAMKQAGYRENSAAGLLACGGALGPVIPPSICMIVYGTTFGVSVPAMFMAAVVPGLLMALFLIVTNIFVCKRQNVAQVKKSYTLREIWMSFTKSWGVLLLPIVVLGGIYGGIFTPTEASAVCVVFAVVLGICYRELNLKNMLEALIKTVETSAMVIIIVGMSAILSWILSATGIPAQIAAKVVPFLGNQYVYIIVLLIILFIIGCLMETVASMLILGPILVPIGLELGVNELHLSMIFCLALIVGMVTPPFGLNLFTACATTGQSFMQVVKGMVPYMVALIIAVIIVSFVPELALFLPHITGVT